MINQPAIALISRDFHLILYDFLRPGGYLDTQYGSDYTKFRETEYGHALIDLIAGMGDVFSEAVTREGQENNLLTAREPQNVYDRAAEEGFNAYLPSSAELPVRLTFNNYTKYFLVPSGTFVETQTTDGDVVRFEVETSTPKANGFSTLDVVMKEGEAITEDLFVSTGDVFERVELSEDKVARDSVTCLVNGEAWKEVTSFATSTASSKHFRVITTQPFPDTFVYFVEFGDNVQGLYPPVGAAVQIGYRAGGGRVGNIPSSLALDLGSVLVAGDGTVLDVTAQALQDGTGGLDSLTLDEVRSAAMIHKVTNDRLVSNHDFALSALVHGGLKRAVALTSNENPLIPENSYYLYGCKELGVALTGAEKTAVKANMLASTPGVGTVRFVVGTCGFDTVTVHVEVRLFKDANIDLLNKDIQSIVGTMLSLDGYLGQEEDTMVPVLNINSSLHPSTVESQIVALKGVKYARVKFDGSDEPFYPAINKIPHPSTITYDIAHA